MGQRIAFSCTSQFAATVQDAFRNVEPFFRDHFLSAWGCGLNVALGQIHVEEYERMIVPVCMVPVGDLAVERYFPGWQCVLEQLNRLSRNMNTCLLSRECITDPRCHLGGAVIGSRLAIATANVGSYVTESIDTHVAEVFAALFLVVIRDITREQALERVISSGRLNEPNRHITAFCQALDVLGYPSS